MALVRLQAILACMSCGTAEPNASIYTSEKTALLRESDARPEAEIANDVVETIFNTSLAGPALRMKLDSIVGAYGWRQNLAQYILEKLAAALQTTHEKLGAHINDAYHRAWEAARSVEGFVIEHPVMCTVIALGVLAIIAPWVLEALGFAELGPIEGT
jgi:ElaB/YqjD/DUF883 family membrane-anchored ribosome-binding protein